MVKFSGLASTSCALPSLSEIGEEQQSHTICAESLTQQLEIEVNDKIDQMRKLSEILTLRIENNFKNEMRKLPEGVRAMSVRDFLTLYSGNVDEAQKHLTKRRVMAPPAPKDSKSRGPALHAANGGAPGSSRRRGMDTPGVTPGGRASTRSRSKTGASATPSAATPSAAAMTPRLHETPRVARAGEVALSMNGSPINLISTVKAVGAKRNRPAEVLLTLDDGTELDLSEEAACKALASDADAAEQAHTHLLTLQDQVNRALKQIGEIKEYGYAKM